jgi:hypothetical protein
MVPSGFNPDIENERTFIFGNITYLIHFQLSVRSAKKANDFFGLNGQTIIPERLPACDK